MPLPDLDAWLPDPDVHTLHRRPAAADPDALWAAAQSVRLDQTPKLGRLVRWRIPGTAGSITYGELFAGEPFRVLDEGERWSVSGLVGSIWTLRRDYPQLPSTQAFLDWEVSGTVRVAFLHGVERDADGRAVLVSEARVGAVDRTSGMRLRAIWAVLGRFETLIAEPLGAAVKRADGRDRAPGPPAR